MLLFFIVGLSVLLIIGLISYANAKKAILNRTLDQLTSIRVIKEGQIKFFFRERINNLIFLANSDYVSSLNMILKTNTQSDSEILDHASEYYQEIKEKIHFKIYGFTNMYIAYGSNSENLKCFSFYNNDNPVIENNEFICKTISELKSSINKNDTICIIDFRKPANSNIDPICLIGAKIKGSSTSNDAILALQIPIQSINNIMLENNPENGLGSSGEAYLVGEDFLMRSNSRFIPNSVLKTPVNTVSVRNAFCDKTGSSLIDDYRTVKCLSSYGKISIHELNWAILAEIDFKEAMIPIVSLRNDILLLSAIICLFLFSVAHIISKMITQPVIRLKNAAKKIGEGNFDFSVQQQSQDEIGMLAQAFNTMSSQLKKERHYRMSAFFDGQEQERQRISREMHDSLGQKLFAIKMLMDESASKSNNWSYLDRQNLNYKFEDAIEEVREISNNLAPHVLKESGIETALKRLCESLSKTSCTKIDFSSDGDLNNTDNKTKTYIYRIAQEGLNNSIKHAQAELVQIQLIGGREQIILLIEDNGKGFDILEKNATSGNGINNIKERVNLLSGSFDIESEKGIGTTLRVKIPRNRNINSHNNSNEN